MKNKTEIKARQATGSKLICTLFNGAVLNNVSVSERREGVDSAIFKYDVEVVVEPTMVELID